MARDPRFDEIPSIFPASRELRTRDGFARDCLLQRRVRCEPDFTGRIPSMTVGDFINATPALACRLGEWADDGPTVLTGRGYQSLLRNNGGGIRRARPLERLF